MVAGTPESAASSAAASAVSVAICAAAALGCSRGSGREAPASSVLVPSLTARSLAAASGSGMPQCVAASSAHTKQPLGTTEVGSPPDCQMVHPPAASNLLTQTSQ